MNVTSTGIAVALAVIVVLGFFLFGVANPFASQAPAVVESEMPPATPTNENSMITDTSEGTGAAAMPGDTITVNYVGKLENGTVFDASANHGGPFSFTLGAGQVIKGWDQGLLGMKVGGKRTLVIPPELAYGDRAVGGVIPANSTLIFEVELVSVTPAAQ
jgi:peptidylprolyl isomerase